MRPSLRPKLSLITCQMGCQGVTLPVNKSTFTTFSPVAGAKEARLEHLPRAQLSKNAPSVFLLELLSTARVTRLCNNNKKRGGIFFVYAEGRAKERPPPPSTIVRVQGTRTDKYLFWRVDGEISQNGTVLRKPESMYNVGFVSKLGNRHIYRADIASKHPNMKNVGEIPRLRCFPKILWHVLRIHMPYRLSSVY